MCLHNSSLVILLFNILFNKKHMILKKAWIYSRSEQKHNCYFLKCFQIVAVLLQGSIVIFKDRNYMEMSFLHLTKSLKTRVTIAQHLQVCTSEWFKKGCWENPDFPSLVSFPSIVLICHFTFSVLSCSVRHSSSYDQLTQLLFCTNIWIWNRHANVFPLNCAEH